MKEFNLKNYLISVLRRASYRTPMRQQAFVAARVDRNTYTCAECKKTFARGEVKVDHIVPVRAVDNPDWTWDEFIARLFCDHTGLQILCEQDHTVKTKMENMLRKQYRDEKKKLTSGMNLDKIKKKRGKKRK